jgi:O-antigen ligase
MSETGFRPHDGNGGAVVEATAAEADEPVPPRGRPTRWSQIRVPIYISALGIFLIGHNQVDVGTLPISDLVFFVLAGYLWLLLLTGRSSRLAPSEFRRSSPRALAASVVLVTFATISGFASWDPVDSIRVVVRLAYLTMLWFWMLRCLSLNRRALAIFLTAWRWGVITSAIAAIAANAGLIQLGIANSEDRQTAWFGHPNDLGGYLAVAVPVFILGAPTTSNRRGATGLWRAVLLGLIVFGLSTTGSMSAFLSASVGSVAAGLAILITGPRDTGRRHTHPLKIMALTVVGAIALLMLSQTDTPVVERFTRFGEGDQYVAGSVNDRGAANQAVFGSFDDILVVGHGLDDRAQADLEAPLGVHNMYLKMLYEAGLIGATALILLLVVALQQAWRLMRASRATALHRDIAAVFGSLVAAVLFSNFQPTSIQRFYWLPIAMIQCYWTLRRTEIASGATEQELNAWAAAPARASGAATPSSSRAPAPAGARPGLAARALDQPGGWPTAAG